MGHAVKIVVIIPTYNERENIGPLIDALEVVFTTVPHQMHILVVDDRSPDGTAEIVEEKRNQLGNVHLLTGEKSGLGLAYIRGMKFVLNVLGADAVFQMDADFSHKPEDVPRMVAALEEGAEIVIGSRYVAGGSIPNEWGIRRKAISFMGNMVARYVAGLYRIRDCTAGFRAIRSSVLSKIDFDSLRIQGYAFQVALLHQVIVQQAIVREIPVDFIDRTRGLSKLGFSDIIEFIINAWWIRFCSSATFLKFATVGASGVVVNLGLFTIFMMLGMSKYLASAVAIEVSIICNFLLNNHWTFKSRRTSSGSRIKGIKLNLVSFAALGASFSTFVALNLLFPHIPPHVPQVLSILPGTFANYFLNSYWTFRE